MPAPNLSGLVCVIPAVPEAEAVVMDPSPGSVAFPRDGTLARLVTVTRLPAAWRRDYFLVARFFNISLLSFWEA